MHYMGESKARFHLSKFKNWHFNAGKLDVNPAQSSRVLSVDMAHIDSLWAPQNHMRLPLICAQKKAHLDSTQMEKIILYKGPKIISTYTRGQIMICWLLSSDNFFLLTQIQISKSNTNRRPRPISLIYFTMWILQFFLF